MTLKPWASVPPVSSECWETGMYHQAWHVRCTEWNTMTGNSCFILLRAVKKVSFYLQKCACLIPHLWNNWKALICLQMVAVNNNSSHPLKSYHRRGGCKMFKRSRRASATQHIRGKLGLHESFNKTNREQVVRTQQVSVENSQKATNKCRYDKAIPPTDLLPNQWAP